MARAPEGDERQCDYIRDGGARCGAYRMAGQQYCVGHARALGLVQIEVPAPIPAADGDGPGFGSNAGNDERDRALALREARRMLKAATTPDAVKAQLIRTLAGVEEAQQAAKAPSIEALDGLTVQELEALVVAHL